MSPGTDRPWNSAFQPDRGLGAFHSLRKAILAQRTQLGLDALKQCDEVLRTAQEPGLPEPLLNLREGEGGSTLVFDDPVYSIWLRFFLRASANRRTEELIRHISKLPSVLQDVERRLTGKANLYVPGSAIALQREDLHPYVMKATPPTYDFSRAPSSSGEEGRTIGHPLRMQAGLLTSKRPGPNCMRRSRSACASSATFRMRHFAVARRRATPESSTWATWMNHFSILKSRSSMKPDIRFFTNLEK